METREREVTVLINGKPVPMNSFVRRVIINTVIGIVSCLKGVEETEEIKIVIK